MRENKKLNGKDTMQPVNEPYGTRSRQQQTDPQMTELKGFVDPSEDLEPTLEDGKKSPDKEPPENVND
jgi:hypothetical protein